MSDCFTSFAMTIRIKLLRLLAETSFPRFLAKNSNACYTESPGIIDIFFFFWYTAKVIFILGRINGRFDGFR